MSKLNKVPFRMRALTVAGITFALAFSPVAAIASIDIGGSTEPPAATSASTSTSTAPDAEHSEYMSVYSNAVQNMSLLVDLTQFEVTEPVDGYGRVTFTALNGGGQFTVAYIQGQDSQPSLEEYFEEKTFQYQMKYSDTLEIESEDRYLTESFAEADVYRMGYFYLDENGDPHEEHIFVEDREDGRAYWTITFNNEESYDMLLDGFTHSFVTFMPSADAYGVDGMWCTPASLESRDYHEDLLEDAATQAQASGTQAGGPASTGTNGTGSAGGSAGTSGNADGSSGGTDGTSTSGGNGGRTGTSGGTGTQSTAPLKLVTYDAGEYTIQIPEGWQVSMCGQGMSISFEVYDPSDPSCRMVYWRDVDYPADSESARVIGISDDLVPASPTMADLVDKLDERSEWAVSAGAGTYPNVMLVNKVEVIDSIPVPYATENPMLAGFPDAFDEAVVRTNIELADGTAAHAEFLGAVYVQTYAHGTLYEAHEVWGISAPADRFDEVSDQLSGCIGSVQFK